MSDRDSRNDRPVEPAADRERSAERPTKPARSAAEWTTLLGSLLVVATLICAALYEHYRRDEPSGTWLDIQVMTQEAIVRGDQFYVPFVVTNRGTKPAEDVVVVFEVLDGESVVEESTIQVPFLANSGSAEGELVTTYDPAAYAIRARSAAMLTP